MIETQKYKRKSFDVDAVQVTSENMQDISEWCSGSVEEEQNRTFVKVPVNRPLDERQTKAFPGDWVLQAGSGFKVYTGKAFGKSFEPAAVAAELKHVVLQESPGSEELRVVSAAVPVPPTPAPPVSG